LTLAAPLPITSGGTGTNSTTYANLESNIFGVLPVANGGTGSNTAAFSGANITNLNATAISSGTIDNARTTASSSNGASTIVARDASGDFTGSTITATLFSGSGANVTSLNASNVSSGTLVAAHGGTGINSVGTSGNVLTSDGTAWVSIAIPITGVTSLNGQTGAITNTSLDTIGSYVICANTTTSGYIPGTTIAGSSLYVPSTLLSFGQTSITSANFNTWNIFSTFVRGTPGNTGYQLPLGSTTLSGTWRAMTFVGSRGSSYDNYGNTTSSTSPLFLVVRVS
jgi:hypothetical protein